MANIKVSEMTEATVFDDGDYTMIVQGNQNKKISHENILGNIENNIANNTSNISQINTNITNYGQYSLQETLTGKTWIDGNPIYRKVLQLTSFTIGTTNINHNISNFGELTNIIAIAYRNGGDYETIPTVVAPAYQSQYQISIYDINDTRFRLFLGSETQTGTSKIEKMNIVFEYTKTTD